MAANNTIPRFETDLAIPPGEFLREEIEARGLTQVELAVRIGRPPQLVNEILQGKKAITAETAIELESVLGLSARLWTNLEDTYRLALARQRDAAALEDETHLASTFPISWLQNAGHIPAGIVGARLVQALRAFFGVASLTQAFELNALPRYRATGGPDRRKEGALAAWLRLGDRHFEAHRPTMQYSEQAFKAALTFTRANIGDDPATSVPAVIDAWAAAGVCLVLTPEPPNVGVNGCTRWVDDFALVQLNPRWRWADIFWFTLFHEAHHVLQHRKRKVYSNVIDTDDETAADRYAADSLVPSSEWQSYVRKQDFGATSVIEFAVAQSIPPGVVVGRLQHEARIPHSGLNDLRSRWRWD